ncbi:hepatocellular carcinoma-associated antigen 59-domain-containing protein [Fennellomyces sp. T-0311]|nr:hepatocellular carcinoma-associated antigen 59-domain-containing protein [Fennellomyces sp. T-0311]
MPIQRKQKKYRKKKPESDDEAEQLNRDGSAKIETIEDLQELRRLRRRHGGIDTEKLSKGSQKTKKKKEAPSDPWKLLTGGLVDKDAVRNGGRGDDEEGTEKKLKLDTFTTQTNALDVDKHMMAYIEAEMRKRRGDGHGDEKQTETRRNKDGLVDIYEELYMLPERLRVQQKHVEEGSVQLSTQMLTAIPEVDLGIDVRLKNIEDTERAKRKYMDEQQEDNGKEGSNSADELDEVPANYEKQIQKPDHRSRSDKRQTATDEIVAERFKKRMRK